MLASASGGFALRILRAARSIALKASIFLFAASPVFGAVTIDAVRSVDRSTSASNITATAFSTTSTNELLLAFVSADAKSAGITVTGVTGAGLNWQLVRRANAQLGTAEIWRAFATTALTNVTVTANLSQSVAASITVVTFAGVDTSTPVGASAGVSAPSGAPSASLVTTRAGSWVFGVGTDWDNPVSRTVASGQTMVHQFMPTVGDTYWVQRQNAPTPTSGTQVFINDTAPTADRYNLSVVEILPAATGGGTTFNLSGSITPAANGANATVSVTQGATTVASVTANASGGYLVSDLANGSYTITPTKPGFTFSPAVTTVTSTGVNQTVNFTASVQTWTISGTVSTGSGTLLTLSGAASASTSADSAGNYTFTGLVNGNYSVTPSKAGSAFTPASQPVTVNGANMTGVNFTGTTVPTWSISGTLSPASVGSGAVVTLTGAASATTTANGSGVYMFSGLANGTYTVTPSKSSVAFTPLNRAVSINGSNVTTVDFAGQVVTPTADYPDLSVIVPPAQISITGTDPNRLFLYTHDTFNGGSGPLEIQPIYNEASGNYQGYQNVYRFISSSQPWALMSTTPVAGAFVFHPAHGHFHFPFASFGLYAENADGSIGAAVAISPKVGFCIADSFLYNSTLPHAGAFGNWGSCSDPTSIRGLSVGAVDEYDRSDDGQSIPLPAGLPNGRYWLRAIADPDDLLKESNESNNETDVELQITGNAVTFVRTVVPTLAPPPSVVMTSPGEGTVSGNVQLAASVTSSGVTSVQFLLDGLPFGNAVAGPSYTFPLDTTTLQNGAHWLAARATHSSGRIGTSPVVFLTVNNTSTSPPTVQISEPEDGETVSAVVNVGAVAAAQVGVPSVQFYVDGAAVGSPDTAPPFMIQWNTNSYVAGPHVLTAVATDGFGAVGNSTPVNVTVDNSHPANVIAIDTTVFRDTSDTMQTPAFSTTTASDLLVAFVAYDGPSGAAQTASVSGAGLTWQLAKRSNTQAGTSEIWFAKASSVLTNVIVTSQPTRTGFHGSLTVVAFRNASGVGTVGQASAPTGAPDIYVPGVASGNWVFAVGNDWDRAVARTPVSGQVLVHQRVDTAVGDTFWVQSTAAPRPLPAS